MALTSQNLNLVCWPKLAINFCFSSEPAETFVLLGTSQDLKWEGRLAGNSLLMADVKVVDLMSKMKTEEKFLSLEFFPSHSSAGRENLVMRMKSMIRSSRVGLIKHSKWDDGWNSFCLD